MYLKDTGYFTPKKGAKIVKLQLSQAVKLPAVKLPGDWVMPKRRRLRIDYTRWTVWKGNMYNACHWKMHFWNQLFCQIAGLRVLNVHVLLPQKKQTLR